MTHGRTLTASFVALCSLLFVFATLSGCDKKGADEDNKETAEKTQEQEPSADEKGEEPAEDEASGAEAEGAEPPPPAEGAEEAPPAEGESAEAPEGQPPAEGEQGEEGEVLQPDMQDIELGKSVEGTIKSPDDMTEEGLEFDSKWYTIEAKKGQTVIIEVEAKNEKDGLRPFVTVLLPDKENKGEWRELDSARAGEGESSVEMKITFKEGGERIITVDDARNIPGPDQPRPEEFKGGENFGFTFEAKVSPGSAVK